MLFAKLAKELFPSFLEEVVPEEVVEVVEVVPEESKSVLAKKSAKKPTPESEDEEEPVEDEPEHPIMDGFDGYESPSPVFENIDEEPIELSHRLAPALDILIEFLPSITSYDTVKIIYDDDDFVANFLERFNFIPVDNGARFLFSIPPPDMELVVLLRYIKSEKPFIVYLPLSVMNNHEVDLTNCRLNLYIVGTHAWFVCSFPSVGNGGNFIFRRLGDCVEIEIL